MFHVNHTPYTDLGGTFINVYNSNLRDLGVQNYVSKQPYHTILKEGDKTYAGGGWRISRGVADSSQVLKGGGSKLFAGF